MGMYDSVFVNCPKCNKQNEFQSKSGGCFLDEYTLEDCPEDVLQNVNRHSPTKCDECGCMYQVDIENRKAVEVVLIDHNWTVVKVEGGGEKEHTRKVDL